MNILIFTLFVILSILSILSAYYRNGNAYKYFKALLFIISDTALAFNPDYALEPRIKNWEEMFNNICKGLTPTYAQHPLDIFLV